MTVPVSCCSGFCEGAFSARDTHCIPPTVCTAAAAADAARLKAEEEAAKAAEYAAITAIFSQPGAPFEEAAPILIV